MKNWIITMRDDYKIKINAGSAEEAFESANNAHVINAPMSAVKSIVAID